MKAHQRSALAFLPGLLLLGGCAARDRSPTIDVLGSYFPAWMACIIAGIVFTLIARQLLIGFQLNDHLRLAPLVYVCMSIMFTMLVWLIFYPG